MNNFWKPSKRLLGKFPCIEHTITGELSLTGKYGEIWLHDESTYKAIIFSHRITRRFLPKDKWAIGPIDEILIKFGAQDLSIWVERLRIPSKSSTQAAIANRAQFMGTARSNIKDSDAHILSLEPDGRARRGIADQSIAPDEKNANLPIQTKNLKARVG